MQGQTINGYTLQHRLGEGGMAEVWYAENEIGKPAAVKILNENLSRKTQIVERFHNEALVMVKLNHPNIRQVYGYGYLGDRHCIIMEYLDGDDLEAMLKAGRRFTDEEVCRWWNQTVDALNYTHAMGIVHRDIKPSNIFLDNMGNIKLLDFGIAKVKESMSMTRTGMMMGTLMYMSPEQVKDPKRVDAKSDIYSLAVTFVHLLSGKPIYDSETSSEFDIQLSIVSQPVDLSSVPSAWQGFLAPYLEKDPEKRPALRHFDAVAEVPPTPTPTVEAKTIVGSMASTVTQPDDAPSSPHSETPSKENLHSGSDPLSPEPEDKPKSRKSLWIGLGIAVVAILSLIMVLLIQKKLNSDKTPKLSSTISESPLVEETTINDEDNLLIAFCSQVLAGTEDVWDREFKKMGRTYQPPKMVIFSDAVSSGCGNATSASGPFYCSADETVYLDLEFFKSMKSQIGADGDFAYAYVIAHEVGHHVQNQLGILGQVHQQMAQYGQNSQQSNQLSVRLELQADFFAGVWAYNDNKLFGSLEDGDIEEALNAAAKIGDDYLQKQAYGRTMPETFNHGTFTQRSRWLKKGIRTGDISQGDTFSVPFNSL